MIETNKNISKQRELINPILQRNKKQTPTINKLVTDDDTIVTDCKDICNKLNNFLSTLAPIWLLKYPIVENFKGKDILNCISSNPNSFFVNLALSMKFFKI